MSDDVHEWVTRARYLPQAEALNHQLAMAALGYLKLIEQWRRDIQGKEGAALTLRSLAEVERAINGAVRAADQCNSRLWELGAHLRRQTSSRRH